MTTDSSPAMGEEHTPTPWQVHIDRWPHYLDQRPCGPHVECTIWTVSHHPQLGGPEPIVVSSTGIGETEGGEIRHMVHIKEADAEFIVRACNAHDALVAALRKIADKRPNSETAQEIARDALAAAGEQP